jgi:hypothetical protein
MRTGDPTPAGRHVSTERYVIQISKVKENNASGYSTLVASTLFNQAVCI